MTTLHTSSEKSQRWALKLTAPFKKGSHTFRFAQDSPDFLLVFQLINNVHFYSQEHLGWSITWRGHSACRALWTVIRAETRKKSLLMFQPTTQLSSILSSTEWPCSPTPCLRNQCLLNFPKHFGDTQVQIKVRKLNAIGDSLEEKIIINIEYNCDSTQQFKNKRESFLKRKENSMSSHRSRSNQDAVCEFIYTITVLAIFWIK